MLSNTKLTSVKEMVMTTSPTNAYMIALRALVAFCGSPCDVTNCRPAITIIKKASPPPTPNINLRMLRVGLPTGVGSFTDIVG
jgi:hypothetical protein